MLINISKEDRELAKRPGTFDNVVRKSVVRDSIDALSGGNLLSLPEILENYDRYSNIDDTILTRSILYTVNTQSGLYLVADHTSLTLDNMHAMWHNESQHVTLGNRILEELNEMEITDYLSSNEMGGQLPDFSTYGINFFRKLANSGDFPVMTGNLDIVDAVFGSKHAKNGYLSVHSNPFLRINVYGGGVGKARLITLRKDFISTMGSRGGIAFYAD